MNGLGFKIGISYFYPERCPVCGEVKDQREGKICRKCYGIFRRIKEPKCKKCGKPIEMEEIEYCFDCQKRKVHFEEGRGLWIYDRNTKRSIKEFKYDGRLEYKAYYIEEAIKYYGDWMKQLCLDAVIPVPLHKSKYHQRGFNQAAVLAQGLGAYLKIPCLEGILLRRRNTKPQKELNEKQRLENLAGAFSVDETKWEKHQNKRNVILADDIYTTGSTIECCSRVLKSAGIQNIYFFALCIGKGY